MKKTTDAKAKAPKANSLREKIRRHLTDKNDVITEQDLREVVVGVDAVDLASPEEPAIQAEDIPPQKRVNPWDIVNDRE